MFYMELLLLLVNYVTSNKWTVCPSELFEIDSFLIGVPVAKRIVEEVKKNDTLIIVGETGSGKTTRMYFYIYS